MAVELPDPSFVFPAIPCKNPELQLEAHHQRSWVAAASCSSRHNLACSEVSKFFKRLQKIYTMILNVHQINIKLVSF